MSVYPLIGEWNARGQNVELRIENPLDKPLDVRWSGPVEGQRKIAPRSSATAPLTIHIPQPKSGERAAVTIDITIDGRYLGPLAFFLVDNK